MSDETYVTNDSWVQRAGRPDVIDDVADQFERPVATDGVSFWSTDADAGWPRRSRGWRSLERVHPRAVERAVG
jgi:hypothetical protein